LHSEPEEFAAWLAIAQGETLIASGRERAMFAPWANLRSLTVFEPENIAYFHEQTPYIHFVEAAAALARCFQATFRCPTHLPEPAAQVLWAAARSDFTER